MTLTELNETLAVQKIKIAEQTENCEQLLASIGESADVAVEKKELSEQKKVEIEEQKKVIAKEEKEAKLVLAEAQPGLDAAKLALGELEKADITEIRFDPVHLSADPEYKTYARTSVIVTAIRPTHSFVR